MSTSDSASPSDRGDAAASARPGLTRRKKLLFSVVVCLGFAVLVEALVRIGFFVGDRFSPYYLTFGFVPDIERHSNERTGYTTFQPNSVYRYKSARDVTIKMHINSDGFRDPEDFIKPKPQGTFRVIALGESSTFGLANSDENTYPAILERRLQERMPDWKVEVYNLGIPHFRSNHILAAARAELRSLEPDIVTLYAGYNNAMVLPTASQPGGLYRAKDWFKHHSVTYRAMHPYIATSYQKISGMLKRDIVGLPHLGLPVELPAARVTQRRAEARAEYRRDLDSIVAVVRATGAVLVPVTQTFTLTRLPGARLPGPYRPYLEEVAHVDSLLTASGSIPAPYTTLLVHRDILEEFREAATRHHLPLVDGVGALDREREIVMASFVHLTDEGNQRLAAAIESTFVSARLLPASRRSRATRVTVSGP